MESVQYSYTLYKQIALSGDTILYSLDKIDTLKSVIDQRRGWWGIRQCRALPQVPYLLNAQASQCQYYHRSLENVNTTSDNVRRIL